jgi:hypothetical protein
MTGFVWSEVREDASRRFGGQLPHGEVEAAILNVFQGQPQRVLEAVDHVARLFEAGKVHSPWALVRSHLERAENTGRVVASDDTSARGGSRRRRRGYEAPDSTSTGSRSSKRNSSCAAGSVRTPRTSSSGNGSSISGASSGRQASGSTRTPSDDSRHGNAWKRASPSRRGDEPSSVADWLSALPEEAPSA